MSSPVSDGKWYETKGVESLASPALLVYADRVEENCRRMLRIAGDPQRIRPHIKTHKMPAIVELQLRMGFTKFKCATVAEAEMAANSGARDLLLAYQPVGPAVQRFFDLARHYPNVQFSVIADDASTVRALSEHAARNRSATGGTSLEVLLDLDIGQHRTGITPDERAVELYK